MYESCSSSSPIILREFEIRRRNAYGKLGGQDSTGVSTVLRHTGCLRRAGIMGGFENLATWFTDRRDALYDAKDSRGSRFETCQWSRQVQRELEPLQGNLQRAEISHTPQKEGQLSRLLCRILLAVRIAAGSFPP